MTVKGSMHPGLKQNQDLPFPTARGLFKQCFIYALREMTLLYSHQFVIGSIAAHYMLALCVERGDDLPENFLNPNFTKYLL